MKKIIYLLQIVLVLLTSCDSILEVDNLTKKDTSNFPSSPKDAESALAGCYSILPYGLPSQKSFYLAELLSDDRFGGAGEGDSDTQAVNQMKKVGENMFADGWKQNYTGIFRCNTLIETIDLVNGWESEGQKKQILGEAHFLRAYFYFELCRIFGTVPLIIETDPVNNPRAQADELYAQIATDLKTAIELLPASPFGSFSAPELGHATKWAAEALIARVYLFYSGYYKKEVLPLNDGGSIAKQQVTDWLDDCIANSGHGLIGDFRNLWPYSYRLTTPDYKYANDNNLRWVEETGANNETIFAIKFSTLADWSTNICYSNQMNLYFGIRSQSDYANCFPFGQGWGAGPVNPDLWESWEREEPTDIRRAGSIIDSKSPDENIMINSSDGKEMELTGFWQKKYIPINAKGTDGTIANYSVFMYGRKADFQLDNTQDIVIIRFADVLLMNAELKKDVSYINRVRERSGLKPKATYTDETLRNERRWELAFEGLRYHDLLRWGIAGEALNRQNGIDITNSGIKTKSNFGDFVKRIEETGGFMPIPQTQIDLSNGVLEQTPGWSGGDIMYK